MSSDVGSTGTNPLAFELNTQSDMQQMGIQIKLHNEGHDRPLAIPTVQHSKHDEV
jgi:hypothetical protein